MTTVPPNPIEASANEAIWGIAAMIAWILLIVAVVLIVNWMLNRLIGKPIRWPRRWASSPLR
jgi:flagellar biogenesis protein FliO